MSQRSSVRPGRQGRVVEVVEGPAPGEAPGGFNRLIADRFGMSGLVMEAPLEWRPEIRIMTTSSEEKYS